MQNLSSPTNRSSSLARVQNANVISLAIFFIAFCLEVYFNGFHWIQILNLSNFALGWFMFVNIHKVRNTIHSLAGIIHDSAHGELHGRIVNVDDGGELKQLCSNMNTLLDNFELVTKEIKATILAASKEDFSRKILQKGMHGEFKDQAQMINQAVHAMQQTHEFIARNTLNAELAQISSGSNDFSTVQSNLTTIVERLKEIAKDGEIYADETKGSYQNLRDTIEKITALIEFVNQNEQSIGILVQRTRDISNVVDMINDIADKTNLLALNAAIEGARAGEVGRGFAVVASEVKNLADQTAKATEEISNRIQSMQDVTGLSARAIDTVSGTVTRIGEISGQIITSVNEQMQATHSIADSIQRAAETTGAFTGNVGKVTRAASETGQAARSVLDAARNVGEQADAMKKYLGEFVVNIQELG